MLTPADADALERLLAASAATHALRDDIRAFAAHRPAAHVVMARTAPRAKAVRVLMQLLASAPELRVARVVVDGRSGCHDFVGVVRATTDESATHAFAFRWDCRWRAREAGLLDVRGLPDQSRAAREFGWRCFAEWTPLAVTTRASAVEEGAELGVVQSGA